MHNKLSNPESGSKLLLNITVIQFANWSDYHEVKESNVDFSNIEIILGAVPNDASSLDRRACSSSKEMITDFGIT